MKTAHLEKEFNILISEHEKRLEELAEKVRQEVIIPYCKSKGYEFTSSMGDFFFTDLKTGEFISINQYSSNKVHKLLLSDINYNHQLGDYVCNVRKDDLK